MSLALFAGFAATGVVGFLGWLQRIRNGAVVSPVNRRRIQAQHAHMIAEDGQYGLEGASS